MTARENGIRAALRLVKEEQRAYARSAERCNATSNKYGGSLDYAAEEALNVASERICELLAAPKPKRRKSKPKSP